MVRSLKVSLVAAAIALASSSSLVSADKGGSMEVVGNSGVSGQMMFLQSNGQVAILDKVENNPIQRPTKKGPAAAVFYNYQSNSVKADDLMTNPFCAGGMTLGDGRWIVVGGNKAVGPGGVTASQNKSPYYDRNGGKSLRFLSPCSGSSCQWTDQDRNGLLKERWYATLEPMRDGHVMILGGMRDGGFVPSQGSNEPSYEFYPNVGGVYQLDILRRTVPLSLYPITFLMSTNEVFIQANKQAILWNTDTLKEKRLPNINGPPRVYPASGGSVMLPLTPANNYRETILFCGGQSLGTGANWGNEGGPRVAVTQRPASTSCTQISPIADPTWRDQDPLPEGRSMGQFINLPDGTLWFGNGVTTGVAGYTTDPNSPGKPVGTSFGDNPSYRPLVYNPNAAAGQKWKQIGSTNIGRLYHSSATLLPDSSILISGSNPSPDVNTKQKWKTTYQVERWYPTWYDQARPSNNGLPNSIGYGGQGFTLNLPSASDASNAKVVVIRTGFSTHGFNMGQRMLELRSAASGNQLNVAAMPANPALFAPGPALMFVVVNGIPSQGKFITVGNGQIGQQSVGAETSLNKRDLVAARTVSRRAGVDHKMNHLQMRAVNTTQAPSLDAQAKQRADDLARALQGEPVQGVKLDSSLQGILDSFSDHVQSAVESVADQFQDGQLSEHLSG